MGAKGAKFFGDSPIGFLPTPKELWNCVKLRLQKLGFCALVFWGCVHCYHLHSAPIIQLSFIVNIVFLVCIAALHSHPAGAISLLLQLLKIKIFLLPTMLCIILFSSSISYHLDFVLNINMILATFLHWCRYWTQIKSNQIYCSDDLVRMSFPLLASLGVRLVGVSVLFIFGCTWC